MAKLEREAATKRWAVGQLSGGLYGIGSDMGSYHLSPAWKEAATKTDPLATALDGIGSLNDTPETPEMASGEHAAPTRNETPTPTASKIEPKPVDAPTPERLIPHAVKGGKSFVPRGEKPFVPTTPEKNSVTSPITSAAVAATTGPSEAVTQIEKAKFDLERLNRFNRAQDGEHGSDIATLDSGINAAKNAQAKAEEEKKKREVETALKSMRQQIKERIEQLNREIAQLEADIAENNRLNEKSRKEREAIDAYIKDLKRTGHIDQNEDGELRDRQMEEHLRNYEARTGQRVDRDNGDDVARVLRMEKQRRQDEERERNAENTRKSERLGKLKIIRDEAVADSEKAMNSELSDEDKIKLIKQSISKANRAYIETKEIEKTEPIVKDTPSLSKRSDDIATSQLSTEDEVANFSIKLAETKKIENIQERLQAQKQLIESLSSDAELIASIDPEAEYLFQEGYFSTLDATEDKRVLVANSEPGIGQSGGPVNG